VFCRFHELTIDTPRNRFVRAALDLMARLVRSNAAMSRCRSLASSLSRLGVGGLRPCRAELALDQVGRNDAADKLMIALAELAFELALPTEESGTTAFVAPEREEGWVRQLFEKAVLGFARFELERIGWHVRGGVHLHWQVSEPAPDALPRMVTDILLDPPQGGRRVIVDTKFSSIFGTRRFGGESLKSGYIYQIYAYLRSQEGRDLRWDNAAGLLLHPAIGGGYRERATIQGHPITFATVDLAGSAAAIRSEMSHVLQQSQVA